jgi:DNA-binding HxlR family transcriptional regulator
VENTRTYGEACATAHALDLIGERWALLVVRELLFGPKRFTDLRAGLPYQPEPFEFTQAA